MSVSKGYPVSTPQMNCPKEVYGTKVVAINLRISQSEGCGEAVRKDSGNCYTNSLGRSLYNPFINTVCIRTTMHLLHRYNAHDEHSYTAYIYTYVHMYMII